MSSAAEASPTPPKRRKIHINLLTRILIAIALGIVCGLFFPEPLGRVFVTFNGLFSAFLNFIIPLLIVALVTPAIADLGRGAGKWLLITAGLAYASTIVAGFLAYGTGSALFPIMLGPEGSVNPIGDPSESGLTPYFTLEVPAVFDVMTALILAFCLGIGITVIKGAVLHDGFSELRDIIFRIISSVIIPLLPVYIFGMFLQLTMNGEIVTILSTFLTVVVVSIALCIVMLLLLYGIAGAYARRNPFSLIKNMMPAFVTALGTSSSAATIPVTLIGARKNGVSEAVASFVIPLCATIHLAGSTIKIVLFALAIISMNALDVNVGVFAAFIFTLGVTMIAAPGVPGGAIMAAVGVLSSMLGFGDLEIGLMIALYIAIDSFGTATNVTGDGALAVIIDRLSKGKVSERGELVDDVEAAREAESEAKLSDAIG